MSEYPTEFLRGIPNKDFLEQGIVTAKAFQFDSAEREDNYDEASINWCDDPGAIELALNQRKPNGKIQFSAGIAVLNLNRTKDILSNILQSGNLQPGTFEYERKPLPENKYHGNL